MGARAGQFRGAEPNFRMQDFDPIRGTKPDSRPGRRRPELGVGVIPGLRALFSRIFARAVARLWSRRPGCRTEAPPAPSSPFFCLLSSSLSFLLPILINLWLSERIRNPKTKCLRNTKKLAGIHAQRGSEPGNHGSRALWLSCILPRDLG